MLHWLFGCRPNGSLTVVACRNPIVSSQCRVCGAHVRLQGDGTWKKVKYEVR